MYGTAKPIIAQNANLAAEKIAVPRTRGSVRRASGFVKIPITPTTRFFGSNGSRKAVPSLSNNEQTTIPHA